MALAGARWRWLEHGRVRAATASSLVAARRETARHRRAGGTAASAKRGRAAGFSSRPATPGTDGHAQLPPANGHQLPSQPPPLSPASPARPSLPSLLAWTRTTTNRTTTSSYVAAAPLAWPHAASQAVLTCLALIPSLPSLPLVSLTPPISTASTTRTSRPSRRRQPRARRRPRVARRRPASRARRRTALPVRPSRSQTRRPRAPGVHLWACCSPARQADLSATPACPGPSRARVPPAQAAVHPRARDAHRGALGQQRHEVRPSPPPLARQTARLRADPTRAVGRPSSFAADLTTCEMSSGVRSGG